MMKKHLLIVGVLGFVIAQAQTGRVGINTEQPTEVLDVEGNGRVRQLLDGSNITDFPRYVVSKTDGTLGYLARPTASEITSKKIAVIHREHTATGLVWNTRNRYDNSYGQPDPNDPLDLRNDTHRVPANEGVQDNYTSYHIFGTKSDNNSITGNYTQRATTFSAEEGDVLNISANINMAIFENFLGGTPLVSLSPNGDRQIIVNLYLYKGDNLVRKTKQVINFNGRNDATVNNAYPYVYDSKYEDNFNQDISLSYVVPQGGMANNYSVSVTVTAKAPRNGQFRIDLVSSDKRRGNSTRRTNLKHHLIVTKS